MTFWFLTLAAVLASPPLTMETYPCGAGALGATNDEYARLEYASGTGQVERARRFETRRETATKAEDRARLERDIERAWYNAARYFSRALDCDNRFVDAWSRRGLALRHLGQFDDALASYDGALALDAGHRPSLVGQARTWLAMGEYEPVRDSYVSLSRDDPEAASSLLVEMQRWAADTGLRPGEEGMAERFAAWVRRGAMPHDPM